MEYTERLVYPAFIKQNEEGEFGVYFPTLFPDTGRWEFPLAHGESKEEATEMKEGLLKRNEKCNR